MGQLRMLRLTLRLCLLGGAGAGWYGHPCGRGRWMMFRNKVHVDQGHLSQRVKATLQYSKMFVESVTGGG